jgi:hypothetical protein
MTKKTKKSKKATKNSEQTKIAAQPEEEPDTATIFSPAEVPQATPATPENEVAVESQVATEVSSPAASVTESETVPHPFRTVYLYPILYPTSKAQILDCFWASSPPRPQDSGDRKQSRKELQGLTRNSR